MSEDLIEATFKNHEDRIKRLEENTKILTTMEVKLSSMEKNIDSINKKLEEKLEAKGKKWDKLVDYLFYFIIAAILGYVAVKVGLK